MPPEKKIFIIAGEASGDLHASNLVREIRAASPNTAFFGLGGRLMEKEGVDTCFEIAGLGIIGVIEAVQKLTKIRKIYNGLLERVDAERPDLAILVDYPGFNLSMARALKKRGVRIVYFISPQLWAWGKSRIHIIKECVEKVLVFFKFEKKLYEDHGISAEFIGHPLIESVRPSIPRDEAIKEFGLKGKKIVAVLPGSRINEVRNTLPVILRAGAIVDKACGGVRFLISKHEHLERSIYDDAIKGRKLDVELVEGRTHDIVNAADFAIAVSGTVTLECAIIGTPMVIIYKGNLFSWMLFKLFIRIPDVGLANIVAGKRVVPELIQINATPKKIAAFASDYLKDDKKRRATAQSLSAVKESLGSPGAYKRAAAAVLSVLNRPS
ncbi:lipid-A-disaccharide synthase [Candidatus Omnitrophota bacterium]